MSEIKRFFIILAGVFTGWMLASVLDAMGVFG